MPAAGVSSCSAMPVARRRRRRSASIGRPVHLEHAAPSPLDHRDRRGRERRARAAAASGVRTRTTSPDAWRTNSSTVVSAISRPRPMTISVVGGQRHLAHQVATRRRPSGPRRRGPCSRLRIQRMPSGSRPLTGSSRISVARVAEQRGGDAEPLAHAEREAADALAGHLASARRGRSPRRPGARAMPCVWRQREQVVVGRAPGVDRRAPRAARRPRAAAPACSRYGLAVDRDACRRVGASRPMIMRIVVDLPAPFGPRKPVTIPGRTVKLRSSTATLLAVALRHAVGFDHGNPID